MPDPVTPFDVASNPEFLDQVVCRLLGKPFTSYYTLDQVEADRLPVPDQLVAWDHSQTLVVGGVVVWIGGNTQIEFPPLPEGPPLTVYAAAFVWPGAVPILMGVVYYDTPFEFGQAQTIGIPINYSIVQEGN